MRDNKKSIPERKRTKVLRETTNMNKVKKQKVEIKKSHVEVFPKSTRRGNVEWLLEKDGKESIILEEHEIFQYIIDREVRHFIKKECLDNYRDLVPIEISNETFYTFIRDVDKKKYGNKEVLIPAYMTYTVVGNTKKHIFINKSVLENEEYIAQRRL